MGGSGGSSWSPPRDVPQIKSDLDNQTKDADYRSEVEKFIQDALSNYNSRDVEAITDRLHIKVRSDHIVRAIKERGVRKFLSMDRDASTSTLVRYKINRAGIQAFAKTLDGEKT